MTNQKLLRLAAALLLVGELIFVIAGILHPSRESANDHPPVFTEYAQSANWTVVHLGQFAGMAIIISGLLFLFFALNTNVAATTSGWVSWAGRLGAVSAVITLALYGVLQGVDGVALKQAVDAWARASDADKAARFASAEVIRWLEWGIRSYQSFMFGLSFILFGIMIVGTARIPKLIGYLMGLSGLAYLVQGWVIGSEGFSANNGLPTLGAYIIWLVWSIWLLIIAWRIREPASVQVTNG